MIVRTAEQKTWHGRPARVSSRGDEEICRAAPEHGRDARATVQTSRATRGFTFLELLLAMAIAAMLALTLQVSMNVAFAARDTVATQTEAPRQAAIALDLIAGDLQASLRPASAMAVPFVGTAGGVGGGVGGGEGATLTFTTIARSGLSRLVRIGTRTDAGVTALVRQEEGGALASALTPSNNEAVLVRDVRAITLRYYNGIAWVDTWDSQLYEDKLPPAVEITIELQQPDPGDASHGYRMSRVVPLPHSSLVAAAAVDEDTEAESGAAE